MATKSERLIFRLEAQNTEYIKKIEQSEKKLLNFASKADDGLGRVESGFNRLGGKPTTSVKKFGKAANQSFAGMGRGAGQASIQLQQFVGQVQAGTNPLLAFSQQAADVGIVLGAPLIGSILGIGAALGLVLLPAIFKTTDAMKALDLATSSVDEILKKLEPGVISLTDRFAELAASSAILSQSKIKSTLQDIDEALKDSDKNALKLAKSLSPGELGGRFDRLSLSVTILKNKFIEGKIGLDKFNEGLNLLFIQTEKPTKAFKDIIKDISEITDKSKKLRESQEILLGGVGGLSSEAETKEIEKQRQSIEKMNDLRSESHNQQLAQLETRFFAISDSLRSEEEVLKDSLNNRLAVISAFQSKFAGFTEEANEAKLRAEEDHAKKLEAINKMKINQSMSFVESSLGIIAGGLGKQSALGKAAFAAQKALSIAKIIVDTQVASAGAMASIPGPAGIVLSGIIQGLGAASVGIVAGQAIASFEGGGSTGSGPRSGGLDGKGGKFAILHPNEKVIDMQRQAANDGGWQVNVYNNGNSQVTQEVDENQKIISIMVDQASKSTSQFMSAMQQNSTIQPRGRR